MTTWCKPIGHSWEIKQWTPASTRLYFSILFKVNGTVTVTQSDLISSHICRMSTLPWLEIIRTLYLYQVKKCHNKNAQHQNYIASSTSNIQVFQRKNIKFKNRLNDRALVNIEHRNHLDKNPGCNSSSSVTKKQYIDLEKE